MNKPDRCYTCCSWHDTKRYHPQQFDANTSRVSVSVPSCVPVSVPIWEMRIMIVPNLSTEDLKKLPLRAIVALAARCARRVESLSLLPDGHADMDRCRAAIDGAIRLAEDFAKGSPCRAVPSVIREVEACRAIAQGEHTRETAVAAVVWTAHAAAAAMEGLGLQPEPAEVSVTGTRQPNPFPHLADVAADLAARDAFTAAVDAAGAAGHADKFTNGAVQDYQALLKLELGCYPEAGQPIDPSPAGPLGDLSAAILRSESSTTLVGAGTVRRSP